MQTRTGSVRIDLITNEMAVVVSSQGTGLYYIYIYIKAIVTDDN